MAWKSAVLLCLLLCAGLVPGRAIAAERHYSPGAPGLGDRYFPLDGNGGYDVQHYLLDLTYDPSTDELSGTATITAIATKNLSRFNLDFQGLTIRWVKVNGRVARWSRDGGELIVTPEGGLRDNHTFRVAVRYDGVPQPIEEEVGSSGFIHTDDGAVIAGEPHVASTWFPVNDHPLDKAAYTFKWTVPRALEVIANGVLESRRTHGRWATWTWEAKKPMASYLATAAIGNFDVKRYSKDGIRYWDAIDTALFEPVAAPRTGTQLAISQMSNPSYKRLARTISVPAGGARISFWVTRDTEPGWDFLFVEAHTVGQGDWTTLRDANGHTTQNTGASCPYWFSLHPFLKHYQADNGDGTCAPAGTSGAWWAASGASSGYEQWTVDLSAWAGKDVEISISYASDDFMQYSGVFVDDVAVSTGAGSTSFEDDGDPLDGWAVLGAPEGSDPNPNNWIVGGVDDLPAPVGETARKSLAREPEIIGFLAGLFGKYPFNTAGGIVDSNNVLAFALETQTRPIYSKDFFRDQASADSVVVHELAHQWVGDSLSVAKWHDIWLNEGFASYAEWLWSEHEGLGSAQEIFDANYAGIPDDSPLWGVKIGDPGTEALFDNAVYIRGAMALHALRVEVGDETFFQILREWTTSRAGDNVTIAQFIRLAERISGKELSPLFDAWLFSTTKPALTAAQASAAQAAGTAPAFARAQLKRVLQAAPRR